jgi:large subunit ribosomal protein L20
MNGTTYSAFINALKNNNIDMDRKALAHIAMHDPEGFQALVNKVSA